MYMIDEDSLRARYLRRFKIAVGSDIGSASLQLATDSLRPLSQADFDPATVLEVSVIPKAQWNVGSDRSNHRE